MQNQPGRNAHVHPAFRPMLALMSGEVQTVRYARTAANDEGPTEAELISADVASNVNKAEHLAQANADRALELQIQMQGALGAWL